MVKLKVLFSSFFNEFVFKIFLNWMISSCITHKTVSFLDRSPTYLQLLFLASDMPSTYLHRKALPGNPEDLRVHFFSLLYWQLFKHTIFILLVSVLPSVKWRKWFLPTRYVVTKWDSTWDNILYSDRYIWVSPKAVFSLLLWRLDSFWQAWEKVYQRGINLSSWINKHE